jgi:predicted ribosome quality control (RQC) complex YloA/Tae2 family protein
MLIKVRDIRGVLLGKRIANVYDLNEKTYLFKFAVPGLSEKFFLLLESGVRFHTTQFVRETPDFPSPFAMKLRKYIRTKRLEEIEQLGEDRVVDFKFGSGESCNHLILELYANGNIILTDNNYNVLALLRSHQFTDDSETKVGEIYPLTKATNIAKTSLLSSIEVEDKSIENMSSVLVDTKDVKKMSSIELLDWTTTKLNQMKEEALLAPFATNTKKKKTKDLTLRQLLLSKESNVSVYGPDLLEHCLVKSGLKPNLKLEQVSTVNVNFIENLIEELKKCDVLIHDLDDSTLPGFVFFVHFFYIYFIN